MLGISLFGAVGLLAQVPPEPPNRTATLAPLPLPIVGRWRRTDPAYEKEVLVVRKTGRVRIGAPAAEVDGLVTRLSDRKLQLDLRPPFGHQRLICRWWRDGDKLSLEILESKSKVDDRDVYRVLDADRSAQGQTWRFQRSK